MQPTLEPGDRVLVKFNSSHDPQFGRVVVAWNPKKTDLHLIQRLNRLKGTGLWLLGFLLLGWYSQRRNPRLIKRLSRLDSTGLWLLGDNPAESTDSRQLGAVPTNLLIGEVVGRLPLGESEQGR